MLNIYSVLLPEGREAYSVIFIDKEGEEHYQFCHLIYKYEGFFYYKIGDLILLSGTEPEELKKIVWKALEKDKESCKKISVNTGIYYREIPEWLSVMFDLD